ncbi:MAG: DUF7133 domain-containing protein, partial [Planctomycetia bacterium]
MKSTSQAMGRSYAAVALFLLTLHVATAAEKLDYVKKATRQETKTASLKASGFAGAPGDWSGWKFVGPFDNADRQGLETAFPPEAEVDVSKKYQGKNGKEIAWRDGDFPDGRVNDLRLFGAGLDNDGVVYLTREITVDRAVEVQASLGSDDALKVFLNGKALYTVDASRSCMADQDFVSLKLSPGKNRLMLKVTDHGGDWAFYFAPAPPESLTVELERRLDVDFPPEGEPRYYRIQTYPIPEDVRLEVGGMGFLGDGSLLVGTRRGQIYRIAKPLSENPSDFSIKEWATGMHEITGMLVENDVVYVAQRPELTIVKDTDGDGAADSFDTLCDGWGISGDYHEYVFGPTRGHDGKLYLTLNVGFGGGHQSKAPWRGWCVQVDSQGVLSPFTVGLRSPNGVGTAPDGTIFYCDNQGEWVAACKLQELRQGEFVGHPAGLRWRKPAVGEKPDATPPVQPPAVWFPYGALSQSASQPVWDRGAGKFGPFAGQAFIGDQTKSLVMRCSLEKVGGRYQGACFHFRRGFECGVNRMEFAPDAASLIIGMT